MFICLLSACVSWEDVGKDVAKGQGTAEVELSEQATAIAEGVATAVESYDEEREQQGKSTCTSAMVPILVVGLALGWKQRRNR
jgi:hypothetical protein